MFYFFFFNFWGGLWKLSLDGTKIITYLVKKKTYIVVHGWVIRAVEIVIMSRRHHFEPFIDNVQELVSNDVMEAGVSLTFLWKSRGNKANTPPGYLKRCGNRLSSLQFSTKEESWSWQKLAWFGFSAVIRWIYPSHGKTRKDYWYLKVTELDQELFFLSFANFHQN